MDDIVDTVSHYAMMAYSNGRANILKFINMSGLQWIRIITIVGGYLLLRPYITMFAEKSQNKQLEKPLEVLQEAQAEKRAEAVISPNTLRGLVQLPEESDSDEEKVSGKDVKWGQKAKRRQRETLRKIIEAEDKARREAEDVGGFVSDEDKDIEHYLT